MDNELNQINAEQEGLSIKEIFFIIKKHWIVICACIAIFTVLGYGFAKYQSKVNPKYSVSATMMVSVDENAQGVSSAVSQYQLSYYLTDTFEVFMTENLVLEEAVERLAKIYTDPDEVVTLKNLKSNFTASLNGQSLVMDASYTCNDPDKAVVVLNTIMESAEDKANEKDENGEYKYKLLAENLTVLSSATKSRVTLTSSTLKYTLIFFAVGVVIAAVYVVIREMTDNKFKSTEEIERVLGVPVLAGVPKYEYKSADEKATKK